MKQLWHYVRLYFMIAGQYIKARMQYRVDFMISSVGMVMTSLATILVFRVLFGSIPNLAGWSFEEILFIYGFYLLSVSPLQIFFDHVWTLRYEVQDGSFIKYYFRPLNMMFYYMSEMVDLKGFTKLALGIAVLVYASLQLDVVWSAWRIGLLVIALGSASLVSIAILIIAASSAFWITFSFPVMSLALKLRDFAPYPTSIFDGAFRVVFTFVIPIGFIAFYPSQLFLRPDQISPLVYLSPLIGVLFFALAYWVWVKGVNSYTGTGS